MHTKTGGSSSQRRKYMMKPLVKAVLFLIRAKRLVTHDHQHEKTCVKLRLSRRMELSRCSSMPTLVPREKYADDQQDFPVLHPIHRHSNREMATVSQSQFSTDARRSEVNAHLMKPLNLLSSSLMHCVGIDDRFLTVPGDLSAPRGSMIKPYMISFLHLDDADGGIRQRKDLTVTCNSMMSNRNRNPVTTVQVSDRPPSTSALQLQQTMTTLKPKKHPLIRRSTVVQDEDDDFSFGSTRPVKPVQKFVRQKTLTELNSNSMVAATTMVKSTEHVVKSEKKRWEKLKAGVKIMNDIFTAVEQDDIGRVRSIIRHKTGYLDMKNKDEFTLLDVSTMLSHNEITKLLLKCGAKENVRLPLECRLDRLKRLTETAQTKLLETTMLMHQTDPQNKQIEKELSYWESRAHLLKKMRTTVDSMEIPNPPTNVIMEVSSSTSIIVSFEQPEQSACPCTKYRVELSRRKDFALIEKSVLVLDLRKLQAWFSDLKKGVPYFARVSSGNFAHFSEPAYSSPACCSPSSWRDVCSVEDNQSAAREELSEMDQALSRMRQEISICGGMLEFSSKKKKPTLKTLLFANNKFQKNLRRGIYLATILYKDDKVLCTLDDQIPVIQVDENIPGSFVSDFLWFFKLSCTLDDVPSVTAEKERLSNFSSLSLRIKMMEAAVTMKMVLGIDQLGSVHYLPLQFTSGISIIVTVQYVDDVKAVQGLFTKWMPICKFMKKQMCIKDAELSTLEVMQRNLLDYLNYYETVKAHLESGLYIGYVKLHMAVSHIDVVVPENLPSVLPFVFIRENPHVSKEEWEWLHLLNTQDSNTLKPTAPQLTFQWSIVSAAKVLLSDLGVGEAEIPMHRLYTKEVIEINDRISFILLLPSRAEICATPGREALWENQQGRLVLPLKTFEVVHLCTYHTDFISRYSRISIFLELFGSAIQQLQREALDDGRAKQYKDKMDEVLNLQNRLEKLWQSSRWLSSVVTTSRSKHLSAGLNLDVLFNYSLSEGEIQESFNAAASFPKSSISSRSKQFSYLEYGLKNNQENEPESGDEAFEEGSDIGYHSDQSVDKVFASSFLQDSALTSIVSTTKSMENVLWTFDPVGGIENPVYDVLPSAEEAAKGKVKAGYVNVGFLPSPPDLLASMKNRFCRTGSALEFALSTRPLKPQQSFDERLLTKRSSATNLLKSVTNQSYSNPGTPAPIRLRTESDANHKKEMLPPAAQHHLDTEPSPGHLPSPDLDLKSHDEYPSSDSELPGRCSHVKRATKTSRPFMKMCSTGRLPTEDLSVIDQLYLQAGKINSGRKSLSCTKLDRPADELVKVSQVDRHRSVLSLKNDAQGEQLNEEAETEEAKQRQSPKTGILKVYAAYPCGLTRGTNVKLQVSSKTTSREIVNIVVRRLNKEAIARKLKSPVFDGDQLNSFCLVVVIGSRERRLREDFPPLLLQNPWKKGKLLVRQRNDTLAALECGNEAEV